MHRNIAAVLVVAFVAVGGEPAAPSSTAEEQVEEQQVLATLDDLMQSYVTSDGAAASRLYHDNLSYGHSTGQIDNKEFAVKDVENGMWTAAKLVDATVTVSGPVAIVRSTMDYAADCGEPKQPCGVRVLWVLAKERGTWQILARQAVSSFNNPTVLCCAKAAAATATDR